LRNKQPTVGFIFGTTADLRASGKQGLGFTNAELLLISLMGRAQAEPNHHLRQLLDLCDGMELKIMAYLNSLPNPT